MNPPTTDWNPLWLSFELAFITTLILFLLSLPLAWWLSRTRFVLSPVVEAIVSLPIVLPPTVIGFYLLIAFSPNHGFGAWLRDSLGIQLVFSFPGLVVASVVYSLPFMVHPLLSGFRSLPGNLAEAAATLGKSDWHILWRVLLPNMKPALLTAAVLTFAHTLGEFGVAMMVGGNIPGETRIASLAIYEQVETLRYADAHAYSLALVCISLAVLIVVYAVNGQGRRRR